MTELELLRTRVHGAVIGALNDEGVLTADQAAAICTAVLAAVDVLLDVGAIVAPRITRE